MTLRFRNPTDQEREALQRQTRRARLRHGRPVGLARQGAHRAALQGHEHVSDDDGEVQRPGRRRDRVHEVRLRDVVAMAIAMGDADEAVFFPLMQTIEAATLAGGRRASAASSARTTSTRRELDLDALGRWLDADGTTFAAVLINRSEVNPIGMGLVPPNLVVPALVEIDVSFTAERPMTCEYVGARARRRRPPAARRRRLAVPDRRRRCSQPRR